MVVMKARFTVWVVGLVYPNEAVYTASKDGSAVSDLGSDATHSPSCEKHSRVRPRRCTGAELTLSAMVLYAW